MYGSLIRPALISVLLPYKIVTIAILENFNSLVEQQLAFALRTKFRLGAEIGYISDDHSIFHSFQ